jgi:hypothetical protein
MKSPQQYPEPIVIPSTVTSISQTKTVAVYYTWNDSTKTLQTGTTTFSVEATGTTKAELEKNLHNATCEYLVKIEEDIVYDILNVLVNKFNSTFTNNQLVLTRHDDANTIGIGYPVAFETYYDWITINFPLTLPLKIKDDITTVIKIEEEHIEIANQLFGGANNLYITKIMFL